MNNVPSQVEVYRVLLTAENADHLTADTSKTSSVPGNSPKPNFTSKRPKSQPNGTQVSGLARARSSRSQNEPQGVSTKEHDQTKADCEPWMSGYKEVQRDHKKLEENFKSSNNALSLATKDLRDHEKSSNGLSHKSDGSFRDSAVKFDSTDEPEWTEEETDPSKRLYGLGLPLLKSNSRALAEQTARWPPPIGKDCDMANYFMCCDQTLRKQMSKVCTSTIDAVAHSLL